MILSDIKILKETWNMNFGLNIGFNFHFFNLN